MSFNKILPLSDPSSINPGVSTSRSSIPKIFKYDVFLSFRGEDTRNNFVGHLYLALQQKGIETYKDDEKIEKGERINDQLLKSIEESRFFIVVFSKTYASSSWCLDELVKIMECQKKIPEQTAYPVFFDVEPTQVRNQNGPVGEAFSRHENNEAAGKWRDAMKELADLAGWELKATTNGDESKSIQIIVDAILKKLHSTDSSADLKLVGMETRINDVLSSLDIGTEDVRMIGIKGMGGGGKTTLARAVYDRISNHFEGKSCVENVKEVSKPSLSGLKKLQKKILKDVLNKQDITFSSVHDGRDLLIATMRRSKILVVLDDVDRVEHLEEVELSLPQEISKYAFEKEIPIPGYEELSWKVVQYANGLPLTIKVLDSFLCDKDKLEWVDAIERLKKIPLKDTMEKLELSYSSLDDDYKEIFLDIACLLKGRIKEDAIRILESCGFHARNGLKVLEQRSLITISEDGDLGMHDHIEEKGKNIVRRSHPHEPNKHSHLWIDEEIEDILANDMGTKATRCLRLNMYRGNSIILMNGLGKMKKLRYLEVSFANFDSESDCETDGECLGSDRKFDDTSQLDESSQYFPNSLKYLICTVYPFLYLPKTFQANNLVGLEMEFSRMVQLWENEEQKQVLKKLKFLSISDSELTTYDFRITSNLEMLSLFNSPNLVELCMPTSCQNLKCIYITHSKLRTFDLGLTPNLETLFLFDGTCFVELHVSVACPNLKSLDLSFSRLRRLDLQLIPNLENLNLQYSDELVEINAPVGCLKKVVYLNLSGCLWFNDFVFSSRCEAKVNCSLTTLTLVGKCLDLCPLHPNSNLPKFRFHCNYEEYLPSSVGNIEKLISFVLCACTDFKKFSDLICSLQFLQILKLECNIPEFPKDLGQLECLEELFLYSTKIKHLPGSICMLKRLKSLEVNNSDLLEMLPEDLGKLECLEKLSVSSKKIEYLLESICKLKCLKELYLTECYRLGKLPEEIGQLECLERLYLSSAKIKHLPDGICMLKHLKYLNLFDCAPLEKLPEDLGRLECLEQLDITYTGISRLPQSIFGLKGLFIAASQELLQLYDLSHSVQ